MNFSLVLQMAAEAEPERIGLVCDGRRWSYGALWGAARGAAAAIRESGCTHVALLDENSEAAAIALFGAAVHAGVPYVPLNYRLADADLAALLRRVTPSCLVGDVERIRRLAPEGGNVAWTRAAFVSAAERPAEGEISPDETGDGIAIQLFTSGTTAAPKAAVLRHANLLAYILGTVEIWRGIGGRSGARLRAALSHCRNRGAAQFDLRPAAHPPAAGLRPRRLARTRRRGARNQRFCRADDAGPDHRRPHGCRRLGQSFVIDGARVRRWAHALGTDRPRLELFPHTGFTNAYGLTETSSTIALLGPEEHRAAHRATDPLVRGRLGSVGRPLPTVEIEIRDEAGRKLPPGERGEIYVRGEQVSGEYRERSALDAQGWFPTRDAGWIDSEGYLHLTGRADDVIVRGGENISPGEIEDVLRSHPAIADAAAFAVPSSEWGEAVGVAVVARSNHTPPSEAELQQLIKARLRSSRVPERVAFRDALPYNEMGKLLRRELRKQFDKP